MLTIPIMSPETDKSRKMFLDDLNACGADRVLICNCEFFKEEKERENILAEIKKNIEFYTNEGLEPGIWTNTLGWGDPRGDDFKNKFSDATRITAFNGNTCTAVCVLDKDFLQYMEKNMEDYAKTGTRLILLDDDLVLSVRPGFTCSCDLHIKEFSRRTGRKWTRKQIQDLFTGEPSEYRTVWMDLTGESIINYCKRLRAAVDRVDPTIRMGLCASYTHYDLDGFDIQEIVNILAGEGNKPYLRLSGAAYWPYVAPRFPGMKISGVMEFVRMQTAWLENTDIELLDENDSYPRTSDVVPADSIEIYDKAMLTQTRVNRLKYILHYGQNKEGDTAFLNEHLNNLSDNEKISEFFKDKEPVGWRVFCAEKKIRTAVLPEIYKGDLSFMPDHTMPYAGILAAVNGIPTKYSGNGPTLVYGEDARYLPNELKNNTIVADRIAASILAEKNIPCTMIDLDFSEVDFSEAPDIFETLKEIYPNLPMASKGIYILASENKSNDEMAILLINDKREDIESIDVFVDGKYAITNKINCSVKTENDHITLDKISALDFAAILLKKN